MAEKKQKRRRQATNEKFVDAASLLGITKVNAYRISNPDSGDPKNGYPSTEKVMAYTKSRRLQRKINERKALAAQFAEITPEMVLGATAMRAFASIDDCFDEHGSFSMKLARESGAIHLVKKLKTTQYGLEAEFYSNESAQQQLANYLGMEFQPKENNDTPSLKAGVEASAKAIAEHMGVPVTHEIRVKAWEQVLRWIRESRAQYSEQAISEVDRLFRARQNGFGAPKLIRSKNGLEEEDQKGARSSNGHKEGD